MPPRGHPLLPASPGRPARDGLRATAGVFPAGDREAGTYGKLIIDNGKLKIMEQNIVEVKSFHFAIRIVNLYKQICTDKKEYVMSKQLLRSGTSIGANIAESQQAQSRADFVAKLNIALKETSETKYWLRLLHSTDYISNDVFLPVHAECVELEKLLVAIIRTTKQK